MACGPPFVPLVDENQACLICGSKKEVFHRQVPITSCAIDHSVKTGMHRQSSLCQKCINDGWVLLEDEAFGGKLHYYNIVKGGSKSA